MKKLIQVFILLMACSFVAAPVVAKDSTTTKDKTVKKAKAKKTAKARKLKKSVKPERETQARPAKNKTNKKAGKKSGNADAGSDRSAKPSGKNKGSDEVAERSAKPSGSDSSSASRSGSSNTAGSSKKGAKKTVRSGLTGTDKAKQFKNVTVNINKADAATLAYFLVGIGETRAQAIVKYRKKNGKFKSNEDLMQVPGIGEKIYAGLKKNVSPSRGEASVPKTTTAEKKTSKKK